MADNNNPIKYSDLVNPDNSIVDLIKQLDELGDAFMNTFKNIQTEAKRTKEALGSVSGATSQNREVIRNASQDAEKLARAQRDLAFAESELAKELAMLKKAQSEAYMKNKAREKERKAQIAAGITPKGRGRPSKKAEKKTSLGGLNEAGAD